MRTSSFISNPGRAQKHQQLVPETLGGVMQQAGTSDSDPFLLGEVTPPRFDASDASGISAELEAEGFACVANCLDADELEHARDLLWNHLEGRECPQMTQTRPIGWKRDDVTSWVEGHGDGLMTSTCHCDSMWFARTRPGVIAGFQAAYGEEELTAAFDRMSVNLPTATKNEGVLRRLASTNHAHGRLNMQELHTHKNSFYDERNGAPFTDFYSIIPLWDMNQSTGATAVVPRSHKRVAEIKALRARNWEVDDQFEKYSKDWWASHKWIGEGKPDEDVEQYTALGLTPCVTNVRAGDMVIFDTALYHSGCAAADPTGASGNGTDQLLRAIYIMGMTPTRLKTARELHARRLCYELDLPWYPDHNHVRITEQVFAQHTSEGGDVPSVRRFREASEEVQRLIDPTYPNA